MASTRTEPSRIIKTLNLIFLNHLEPRTKRSGHLKLIDTPQPSKAGQHSNTGNTENTTKIFCKKSNPKAHNRQIKQG